MQRQIQVVNLKTRKQDESLICKPVMKEKDYWEALDEAMSDKDIAEMHKQIIDDLGYDPNNVKPVGHERWWLDE